MPARSAARSRRHPIRTAVVGVAVALFVVAAWILARITALPEPTIDVALLDDAPYARPVWVGNLASAEIAEASGLARSHRDPARLWIVNDSGNPPVLHALGTDGAEHGAVPVRDLENDDWEDLASVEREGVPYLVIAETGDNLSRKPERMLHFLVEPGFAAGSPPTGVSVAWSVALRFEDGPRDCESVAVDPASGEILLLSKRDVPARLYALAWPEEAARASDAPLVARFVTEVFNIPQPTRRDGEGLFPLGAMLAQPTSLAISPDGAEALVLTYGGAYRFAREPGESWRDAFGRLPGRIRMPSIRGAEAIGYAPDGRSFFLTTEGRRAPLYRYAALSGRERAATGEGAEGR